MQNGVGTVLTARRWQEGVSKGSAFKIARNVNNDEGNDTLKRECCYYGDTTGNVGHGARQRAGPTRLPQSVARHNVPTVTMLVKLAAPPALCPIKVIRVCGGRAKQEKETGVLVPKWQQRETKRRIVQVPPPVSSTRSLMLILASSSSSHKLLGT